MPKLTTQTGVVVDVSDDKADRLVALGYKAETKAPAKKAASSKSEK